MEPVHVLTADDIVTCVYCLRKEINWNFYCPCYGLALEDHYSEAHEDNICDFFCHAHEKFIRRVKRKREELGHTNYYGEDLDIVNEMRTKRAKKRHEEFLEIQKRVDENIREQLKNKNKK